MSVLHTHTQLPFNQKAAKFLPGRTIGNTNQDPVVQDDGLNHVLVLSHRMSDFQKGITDKKDNCILFLYPNLPVSYDLTTKQ